MKWSRWWYGPGEDCKGNPLTVTGKSLQLQSLPSGFPVQRTDALSNLERSVSLWGSPINRLTQHWSMDFKHNTSVTIHSFKTAVTSFEGLSTYTPFWGFPCPKFNRAVFPNISELRLGVVTAPVWIPALPLSNNLFLSKLLSLYGFKFLPLYNGANTGFHFRESL